MVVPAITLSFDCLTRQLRFDISATVPTVDNFSFCGAPFPPAPSRSTYIYIYLGQWQRPSHQTLQSDFPAQSRNVGFTPHFDIPGDSCSRPGLESGPTCFLCLNSGHDIQRSGELSLSAQLDQMRVFRRFPIPDMTNVPISSNRFGFGFISPFPHNPPALRRFHQASAAYVCIAICELGME